MKIVCQVDLTPEEMEQFGQKFSRAIKKCYVAEEWWMENCEWGTQNV